MNFDQAYDLLKTVTPNSDNADKFKRSHLHYNFIISTADIKQYLDFIKDNCLDWIEGLPDQWKSKTTLSKPKTAIIKLLEQPQIRTAYGQEYTEELIDIIASTWKHNSQRIIDDRINEVQVNDQVNENTTIEDEEEQSVIQENTHDLHQQIQNLNSRLRLHKKLFIDYIRVKEDPNIIHIWETMINNI